MAKLVFSDTTDPYQNLALENHLYETFDGETTLYVWQNAKTVVIGKWQNAYKEVDFTQAHSLGIRVARRTTGGGAVYHHLGNLNFTFIASPEVYDTARQLGVIARATGAFDIRAEVSGRNDLTANGLKFSGNAFKSGKSAKLHHGTVLIDEDTSIMTKVLNVSPAKLHSKGVNSVKSRVVNLKSINPSVTVSTFSDELVKAFIEVYGEAKTVSVPPVEYAELAEQYSSDEWILGANPEFDFEVNDRLSFGELTLGLKVKDGKIVDVKAYTDSLDLTVAPTLESALIGVKFAKTDVETVVKSATPYYEEVIHLFEQVWGK